MRTTLDINAKTLEDVVKATGEKTKSKAVTKVLKEYLRDIKITELRAMAGKIDVIDNWRELEELELKRQRELQW